MLVNGVDCARSGAGFAKKTITVPTANNTLRPGPADIGSRSEISRCRRKSLPIAPSQAVRALSRLLLRLLFLLRTVLVKNNQTNGLHCGSEWTMKKAGPTIGRTSVSDRTLLARRSAAPAKQPRTAKKARRSLPLPTEASHAVSLKRLKSLAGYLIRQAQLWVFQDFNETLAPIEMRP